MAAHKHPDQILAGSLNLLAPADMVPQGDSPILSNFRVDQANQLRSRHGSTQKASGLGSSGRVHSLFRSDNDRYVGAGTVLYHGETAGTTVATGFSGSGIDFCAYQGRTFGMDPTKRVACVGNSAANWGIVRPATAPVLAAGANVTQPVVSFDNDEGWDVYRFVDNVPTSLTPDYSADPADVMEGTHSLHLECNPPARYYTSWTPGSPWDTRAGGSDNSDDVIRFWIKCSNRDSLESVFISLYGGSSNEKSVFCQVPISAFTPAVQSWTHVAIRRRLVADSVVNADPAYREILARIDEAREAGNAVDEQAQVQARDALYADILARTLAFSDVSQNATFDWSAVNTITVEVTALDACDVFLDAIDVMGGVDAGAYEGEFRVAVSYGNDWDEESSMSDMSNAITVKKQKLSITSIPVSADPQVTVKYLYAVGGTLDRPLRIASIGAAATSHTSDASLDDVRRLFEEGPVDHDPPPAASGLLEQPYMARLIAWHGATVYWSKATMPSYWPEDDNWEEVGDSTETIVRCTAPNDRELRVWKRRSIHRYPGDPNDVQPDEWLSGISAVGKEAICTALRQDFFVSADGVYSLADYPRKLSIPIEPLFNGDYVDLGGGDIVPPIERTKLHRIALGYRDGFLWMSYPEAGQTDNNRTLIYDVESKRWMSWTSTAVTAFACFFNEGSYDDYSGFLIAGGTAGRLLELDAGITDSGAAIPVRWRSCYYDQGLPTIPKIYTELVIDGRTAIGGGETPATLTVKVVHSDGISVSVGTMSAGDFATFSFNLGSLRADNIAVEISGSTSATIIVRGVYLYWYPEARQGLVFDTGVFDLGTEEVDEVKEFRLVMTTLGNVTANLYGDLAGGSMALVETVTLTHQAGSHRTYPLLPASGTPWMNRRWRIVAVSTAKLQMHIVRAHHRTVGEFLQGADTFDPGPMSLGG